MSADAKAIHKILLAVDGSEHSLAAVRTVQDFTLASGSCAECLVMLIGALPHTEGSNQAVYLYPLQQAQKMLQESGIQTSLDLIQGFPAEVILDYAVAQRPDLIVIGAKGLRATFGILLGGVAQRVVEYAECPVLIIRAPYRKITHVLIVTDGSEHSRNAVEFAAKFPFSPQTLFHLLHVLPPSAILTPETLARVWSMTDYSFEMPIFTTQELEEEVESARKAGQAILDEANRILLEHNIHAKTTLLRGDAATEVLQYAKESQIDMLVAGSRGLSQMQSWLVGSVSRKLVHYAECSVLLVKRHSVPASQLSE